MTVFSPDVTYKIGMKVNNKHGITSQKVEGSGQGDSAGGLAHDSSQYIKVGSMQV